MVDGSMRTGVSASRIPAAPPGPTPSSRRGKRFPAGLPPG